MVAEKEYMVLTRREIEHRIAEGQKLFIFEGHVVRADAWLNYHPGGDKIILHMVGKDATDEVTAYGLHFYHDRTFANNHSKLTLTRRSQTHALIPSRQD